LTYIPLTCSPSKVQVIPIQVQVSFVDGSQSDCKLGFDVLKLYNMIANLFDFVLFDFLFENVKIFNVQKEKKKKLFLLKDFLHSGSVAFN